MTADIRILLHCRWATPKTAKLRFFKYIAPFLRPTALRLCDIPDKLESTVLVSNLVPGYLYNAKDRIETRASYAGNLFQIGSKSTKDLRIFASFAHVPLRKQGLNVHYGYYFTDDKRYQVCCKMQIPLQTTTLFPRMNADGV